MIGYVSWMQPMSFAAGVAVTGLAAVALRRAAACGATAGAA